MWYERGRWISLNLHRQRTSHWADEERRVGATGTETAFLNKYVVIGRRQHTVCVCVESRGQISPWIGDVAQLIECLSSAYSPDLNLHNLPQCWLQPTAQQPGAVEGPLCLQNRGYMKPWVKKEGKERKEKRTQSPRVLWSLELWSFPGLKDKLTNRVPLLTETITFDSEMSPQARVCVLHPQLMVLLGGCGTYRSQSLTAETGNI